MEQVLRWVGPVCNDPSGSGDRPFDEHLPKRQLATDDLSAGIPDDTVQTSLLVLCGAGFPDDTVQTSLLVLCGAGFPDDTVQTSLLVLCGAGLPDWKQEAQHAHCGGPVELYEDLKP